MQCLRSFLSFWFRGEYPPTPANLNDQPKRCFRVFTDMPSNQMPPDDYYIGLETAFAGYNKPGFAADMPLLGDAYADISDVFDAFRNHDLMPQTF